MTKTESTHKYTIFWLIADKKELKSELHSLSFTEEEDFNAQINYLVSIHKKNHKKVKVFYENKHTCHIVVGL